MEVIHAGAAPQTSSCSVHDASQVGQARRAAMTAAEQAGMDETRAGRVGVVATELASNLAKHARDGVLHVRILAEHTGHSGLELIAVDRGPGFRDAAAAMRDGYSTGGTRGAGMGAVARMSDSFDVFTQPGAGAVVMARIWSSAPPTVASGRVIEAGAVCAPAPGERVAGDGWVVAQDAGRTIAIVIDGLGHGDAAAEATRTIAAAARQHLRRSPGEMLERLHDASRSTRGAAVAVAELEQVTRTLRFAGVGNVSAALVHLGASRSLPSHNGIIGHQVRKVQEFVYEWPPDSLLLMHSDGVATRWRLDQYPGLAARHPSLIAAVLHRDFVRGRDDATVLALREASRDVPLLTAPG